MRVHSLVAKHMLAASLAKIELDPRRVKVEWDGVGSKVLLVHSPELLERDDAVAIEVEEAERNLHRHAVSAMDKLHCVAPLTRKSASGRLSSFSNATKSSSETLPSFLTSAIRNKRLYCCRRIFLRSSGGAIAVTNASSVRYLCVAPVRVRNRVNAPQGTRKAERHLLVFSVATYGILIECALPFGLLRRAREVHLDANLVRDRLDRFLDRVGRRIERGRSRMCDFVSR